MPAVKTRLLIGDEGPERWSHQALWDVALKDVQIVFSTFTVLADALCHAFVKLRQLALIVFDEGLMRVLAIVATF